eukprot:2516155-Amphidinium_carterae.1
MEYTSTPPLAGSKALSCWWTHEVGAEPPHSAIFPTTCYNCHTHPHTHNQDELATVVNPLCHVCVCTHLNSNLRQPFSRRIEPQISTRLAKL